MDNTKGTRGTIPPQTSGRAPAASTTPTAGDGAPALPATPPAPGSNPLQVEIVTPQTAGLAAPGDLRQQLASQVKADSAPLSGSQLQDKSDAPKSAGSFPAKPGTILTEDRHTEQTHLLVRARSKSFRRGGLTFTEEPQIVKVEDIGAEKAAAIEAEPSLESKRITAQEAEYYADDMASSSSSIQGMSDAQIRQSHAQLSRDNESLRAEVKRLNDQYPGTDTAPKHGDDDRFRRP